MSAAAIEQRSLSFFFFFTYRILIAVIVMPILLSFVIQSYVTQRKRIMSADSAQSRILADRDSICVPVNSKKNSNSFINSSTKYIEFFERKRAYYDHDENIFEKYMVKAFFGTSTISLWSNDGSETYRENPLVKTYVSATYKFLFTYFLMNIK